MAQTSSEIGNSNSPDFNLALAGTGDSGFSNLKAEFTDISHTENFICNRSADPNSA